MNHRQTLPAISIQMLRPSEADAPAVASPSSNVIELSVISAPLRRADRRAVRNVQQFAFSF